MGWLQPVLRKQEPGAVLHARPRRWQLRRAGPHRVVRPPLRPRLGQWGGRLRRQRAAGHLPGRADGTRRHLLDRCRPACPSATARRPPGPRQSGPRRVLVGGDARRCRRVARRRCEPGLPRRQRLLPADPVRVVPTRPRPAPGLLQVRRRGPDHAGGSRSGHGELAPGSGVASRVRADREHVSGHRRPGRPDLHRPHVVGPRGGRAPGRPAPARCGAGRVRPLRPPRVRTRQPGRDRPLHRAQPPEQLLRRHLVHRPRRWRRVRHRQRQLGVGTVEQRPGPTQRAARIRSRT